MPTPSEEVKKSYERTMIEVDAFKQIFTETPELVEDKLCSNFMKILKVKVEILTQAMKNLGKKDSVRTDQIAICEKILCRLRTSVMNNAKKKSFNHEKLEEAYQAAEIYLRSALHCKYNDEFHIIICRFVKEFKYISATRKEMQVYTKRYSIESSEKAGHEAHVAVIHRFLGSISKNEEAEIRNKIVNESCKNSLLTPTTTHKHFLFESPRLQKQFFAEENIKLSVDSLKKNI